MSRLKKYFLYLTFSFIIPSSMMAIIVAQFTFTDSPESINGTRCIECEPISMRNVYVLEDRIVVAGGIKPEIGAGFLTSMLYGVSENSTTIDSAGVTMHLLSGNDIIHPVMTGAPINYTVVIFNITGTESLITIENVTKSILEMKNETGIFAMIRDFPVFERTPDNTTMQILEYCPKWSALMVNADGPQSDGMYDADIYCENQEKSFTTFLLENNLVMPNYTMCGMSEFTDKYCP